ncbi:hypothetical protein [Dictyobacter kobayashii]|uniref:hypothetical protein n=1 Tax=Dictyobacter kobayashii TaxID=2014872 RepID=UPI000F82314E|nr:hypothetical protein [Dictyobacter kobayashii]
MLKAVAAALVLIIGAAVVLWYANTLNSWVLGGLIGGLAALLLSIPISLTLFSYLARQHEERERTRVEEEEYPEDPRSVMYEYRQVPERVARTIYIEEEDEYFPHDRSVWGEEYTEEPRYLPAPPRRQLPPPASHRSDSAAYPVYRSPSTQRGRPTPRQLAPNDADTPSRRSTTRRLQNPGFPGYQADMTRSQFQSQALRIARQEASQRADRGDRHDQGRPRKPPTSHGYRQAPRSLQDSEQESYPSTNNYPRRGKRIIDANPSPNSPYRSLSETEGPASQKYRYRDPETEIIQQDFSTADLKRPLQRRAPYMYDDDALKDELAQQIEPPITRRSSRNLTTRHDEE